MQSYRPADLRWACSGPAVSTDFRISIAQAVFLLERGQTDTVTHATDHYIHTHACTTAGVCTVRETEKQRRTV